MTKCPPSSIDSRRIKRISAENPSVFLRASIRRSYILALLLLVFPEPTLVLAQDVLGHVVDIKGDWYLYANDATNEEKPLSKWQDLPAGGVIRAKSPVAGDYITIVDSQLKPLVAKRCETAIGCHQPIILPHAIAPGESLPLLHHLWSALLTEPYLPSLHRVRGLSPVLSEGVARLKNNRLYLAEIMRGLPGGEYSLNLYDPQRRSDQTAQATTFHWDPNGGTSVSVRNLNPGIYEATRESGNEIEPTAKASLLLLVCGPQEYQSALSSFQNIRALTDEWENATSETVHTFLRGYLVELAAAKNATKQT